MPIRRNRVAAPARRTEIIGHWPKLIERLQYSPQDFYSKVEKALVERQVPDLWFGRVDWPEGGMLSDKREYLRITRERLVFDVCGAPFGSGFFVSVWTGERPARLGFLAFCFIAVAFLTLANLAFPTTLGLYDVMHRNFGITPLWTNLLLLAALAAIVGVILVEIGPNPDAFLLGLPIVGYFYERYFRKITYYRIDRMCMYQQAVWAAVMQVIDEIAGDTCVRPWSEFDGRPVLRELAHRQGGHGGR